MNESNLNKDIKYIRYLYLISTIAILAFCSVYGRDLVRISYGMITFLLQGASTYCAVKALRKQNGKGILVITGIVTFCFIIISLHGILTSIHISAPILTKSIIIIATVLSVTNFIYGVIFGFIGYMAVNVNNERFSDKYSGVKYTMILTIIVLGAYIICASMIDNVAKNIWIPNMVFYIGLFFIQYGFSYCLFRFFERTIMKAVVFGSFLIGIFIIIVRTNLLCFYTNEVANTGWAFSFLILEVIDILRLHSVIGFVIVWFLKKSRFTATKFSSDSHSLNY